MNLVCQGCGAAIPSHERIGRRDACPACGVDLHSCRHCRFYDARAYNACREPQAERVLDKKRANFCDYFAPLEGGAADVRAADTPGGDARADLERLFRRR